MNNNTAHDIKFMQFQNRAENIREESKQRWENFINFDLKTVSPKELFEFAVDMGAIKNDESNLLNEITSFVSNVVDMTQLRNMSEKDFIAFMPNIKRYFDSLPNKEDRK